VLLLAPNVLGLVELGDESFLLGQGEGAAERELLQHVLFRVLGLLDPVLYLGDHRNKVLLALECQGRIGELHLFKLLLRELAHVVVDVVVEDDAHSLLSPLKLRPVPAHLFLLVEVLEAFHGADHVPLREEADVLPHGVVLPLGGWHQPPRLELLRQPRRLQDLRHRLLLNHRAHPREVI